MLMMMNISPTGVLDDEAFRIAVPKYKERIFLLILKYVRNRDDALDLTQDTFIRAYKARDSFKGQSNLFTWLYRIAVNLALNFKSRNKTSSFQSIDDIAPLATKDLPSDEIEVKEMSDRIDKAVVKLPPRQRMTFVLRYYDELPYSEISESMNISEGAAKANYHQAIKNLRENLRPYVVGDQS